MRRLLDTATRPGALAAFSLAGLALTGVACMDLDRRDAPPAAGALGPHPMACRFVPGETRGWRLAVQAEEVPAGAGDATTSRWQAHVDWRVLGADGDGGWLLGARLRDVRARASADGEARDLLAAVARPFLVRLDRRCALVAVGHDPRTPVRAARAVEELLRRLEVLMPEDPEAERWQALHGARGGAFSAAYRRFGSAERPTLARERAAATELRRDGSGAVLRLHFQRSEHLVRLAGAGRWLDRLDGREDYTVTRPDGSPLADVHRVTRLRTTADARDPLPGREIDPDGWAWIGPAPGTRPRLLAEAPTAPRRDLGPPRLMAFAPDELVVVAGP